MFGAEGVGWRGLGRDAAPPAVVVVVVVATATAATETATATLWGVLPAAKTPSPSLCSGRRGRAAGAEDAFSFPGCWPSGRWDGGGLKGGKRSACVPGARCRSPRGLAFFVAGPRPEDGSCRGSSWLVTAAAGRGPRVILLSGGPGLCSLPREGGARLASPCPLSLAPGTGEIGARPHLSGAKGEESWHCSHKTNVM